MLKFAGNSGALFFNPGALEADAGRSLRSQPILQIKSQDSLS